VKGPNTYGGLAVLNLSGSTFQIQGHTLDSAVPNFRGALDLKSRFKHWVENLDLESHCAMKELAEERGLLLLVMPTNCTGKMRVEVYQILRNWLTEMHVPCPESSQLPMKIIELSEVVQEPV
jgi:hypothetical protein